MCGIAGELRFGPAPTSADWPHLIGLMARRGPDDEGVWSSDRCTLVFRRLAILDLTSAGHQPMTAAGGRYALVLNGEVYNFTQLRDRLEGLGIRFRSTGDAEVVLQSLIAWGPAALERFNGMFALAFYDASERRLLLARDHAGIKPLYVLRTAAGVAFGSQYDQILRHPWSRSLGISGEALGLYLRLAYIPAPYALLEGTRMVEPGQWIEFTGEARETSGRFFTFPRSGSPSLSGHAAVEAVDAAVAAAVRRQLVSDVPVGAFLSGGIDSPLVVANMRAAGGGRMRTFTIGTGGHAATDETADAAAYARELGVDQDVVQVTPEDGLSLLDDVISACGEPFGDFSIFPTMLVARRASREFKVMLSGDGGDELFFGYARRFGPLMKSIVEPPTRRPWTRRLRTALGRSIGGPNQTSLGARQLASHTHLAERRLNEVFYDLPRWPRRYDAFDFDTAEPAAAAAWLRWNEFIAHLPMVLLKVDRASMHHSLEVRVPLLDREVVDVAARVDWRDSFDLGAMRGKLPLRKSLAKRVSHQSAAKRGFAVPMGEWLRTSLRPAFEDLVLGRDALFGLAINRPALRAIFDRHLTAGADYSWGLWPLLSLALWAKRHFRARSVMNA